MNDDLIQVLQAAQACPGDDSFLTFNELCKRMPGMSNDGLRNRLHQLADDGRLEVAKVFRTSIAGDRIRIAAYRLKPE